MINNLMVDPCATGALCEPCEHPARRLLECLERPDFFNGQHLTDEDLDAIIEWTRGRLRLERLREGWGVVCGLNVSVDTRNAHRPVLRISPGYAVDGCGEDIVACDELCKAIWKECGKGVSLAKLKQSAVDASDSLEAWGRLHKWKDPDWSWDDEKINVCAVDLYVCFHESQTRPALKPTCSTHGTSDCDYGGWRESACLKVEPATDPCPDTCESDTVAFNDCLRLISEFEAFYDSLPNDKDAEKIRKWFLNQIDGRNQSEDLRLTGQRIPFVRNWVAQLTEQELKDTAVHARIFYYLIIELRLQLLANKCPTNSEPCVRLARVWLWVSNDSACCEVIGIDTDPPYRRKFTRDATQCPQNRVNLGQMFWVDHDEATTMLSDLGVVADSVDLNIAGDPASLKRQLFVDDVCTSGEVMLQCDPDTGRVVGFTPKRPGVAEPASVESGETEAPANNAHDAGGDADALPTVPKSSDETGAETKGEALPAVARSGNATEPVPTSDSEKFRRLLESDTFPGIRETRAKAIIKSKINSIEQLGALDGSELKRKMDKWAADSGSSLGHIDEGEYEKWVGIAQSLVQFVEDDSTAEVDADSQSTEESAG